MTSGLSTAQDALHNGGLRGSDRIPRAPTFPAGLQARDGG
jgi:hypothetical protein